ncbi:hypothetical protein DXG01_002692 [Tephrocybe rancida]|nr:hypothetical protein DXG01_002692 [Tephrocybe rancida]
MQASSPLSDADVCALGASSSTTSEPHLDTLDFAQGASREKRTREDGHLGVPTDASQGAPRRKCVRLLLSGAGGGGGGGGAAGPGNPQNWDPDCHRNGERTRLTDSLTVNNQQCQAQAHAAIHTALDQAVCTSTPENDEDLMDAGDPLQGGTSPMDTDPDYEPPTGQSQEQALTRRYLGKLKALIDDLQRQAQHLPTIEELMPSTGDLSEEAHYELVDKLFSRCEKLERNASLTEYRLMTSYIQLFSVVNMLESTYGLKIKDIANKLNKDYKNFWNKVAQGSRLAYLVAAGNAHILLVIAAMNLRATHMRDASIQDTGDMGIALRQPPDDEVGTVLKTILIPLIRSLQLSPLPALPILLPGDSSGSFQIVDIMSLTYARRDELMNNLTTRQDIFIWDSKGELLLLLITDFPERHPEYNKELVAMLQVLFKNELFNDDSRSISYSFLSCHYSYYNRYAEQGDGAPEDAHPHNVHREGATHVNNEQRHPHESAEMKRDVKVYDIAVDFLQKLMDHVETKVRQPLKKKIMHSHI